MSERNEKSIKVLLNLPEEIQAGQDCEVTVNIKNISSYSIIINKRLSVGYQLSLSRELYVIIYKHDSSKDVGIQRKLYEREFSLPEDYIELPAEQQISKTFNLFEWYEFPGAGKYTIQICYQADEKLALKPNGLIEGVFCSEKKSVIYKTD